VTDDTDHRPICPECGDRPYDLEEHYACGVCTDRALGRSTQAGAIVKAFRKLLHESASRLRIIGHLVPRLTKFLRELHATITSAVREERMAAELDAIDDKGPAT